MRSGSKSVNVAPTIEPWFSENWPSCRGYVCLQLFCIKHSHRLAQFNVASKHDRITSPPPQLNVPKIKAIFFYPGNVSFWGCNHFRGDFGAPKIWDTRLLYIDSLGFVAVFCIHTLYNLLDLFLILSHRFAGCKGGVNAQLASRTMSIVCAQPRWLCDWHLVGHVVLEACEAPGFEQSTLGRSTRPERGCPACSCGAIRQGRSMSHSIATNFFNHIQSEDTRR